MLPPTQPGYAAGLATLRSTPNCSCRTRRRAAGRPRAYLPGERRSHRRCFCDLRLVNSREDVAPACVVTARGHDPVVGPTDFWTFVIDLAGGGDIPRNRWRRHGRGRRAEFWAHGSLALATCRVGAWLEAVREDTTTILPCTQLLRIALIAVDGIP
jgi:hypothetical protein